MRVSTRRLLKALDGHGAERLLDGSYQMRGVLPEALKIALLHFRCKLDAAMEKPNCYERVIGIRAELDDAIKELSR